MRLADEPAGQGSDQPRRQGRLAARLGRGLPVVTGALLMLLAVLLYGVLSPGTPPLSKTDVQTTIADALASVTPAPAFSERVYQAVRPSLVLIETTRNDDDVPRGEHDGLGSGVVVSLAGDILTSLHVVADATEVHVTFADGTRVTGEVVATQPENDIAVVRAGALPAGVVPAVLGDPASVHEGMDAYAMGSPFGLGGSMSVGVVSGIDREFKLPDSNVVLHRLIQIDAAVNPGNSGGPLLDRDGRVIGIVTALINPTEDDVFIGIGLAVRIDVAGGAAGLPPY